MLVVKNTISAITQSEKRRLLWTIQAVDAPNAPNVTSLFFKIIQCSGCLVSHTLVMHVYMYSLLLMLLNPRDHGWETAFCLLIKIQVLLVPLNTLNLCGHQCSKIHIVSSAGPKQGQWGQCYETPEALPVMWLQEYLKSPWVYRVGLLCTRNIELVIIL